MRDVLFRGKTDKGKWVHGYYVRLEEPCKKRISHRIYSGFAETDVDDFFPEWQEVLPDTVGQNTGLLDMDGKELYEGDIVWFNGEKYVIGFEESSHGGFSLIKEGHFYACFGNKTNGYIIQSFYCRIIGNVHDNPEFESIDIKAECF